jgi:negative regulator of flagellin synthesis FlgM
MMVNSISQIDPIQNIQKQGQTQRVQAADSDSISLSAEAVKKSELYHFKQLVSAAPDIREDRVAELKAKINDPNYINDTILNATTDKIMEAFGL